MLTKEIIISKLREQEVKTYLQSHQMKHIWLAGSYVHNTATPHSDIDIVYDFDTTQSMLDWGIISSKVFLENHLCRSVDILDREYIDYRIKENVLSSAVSIW